MQDSYAKNTNLDIALEIRDRVRKAVAGMIGAKPDPGNLASFRVQTGQSFVFEVTGHSSGSVWGSDVYTDDSSLASSAVHAGVLREGQRGMVKVTILPGQESYEPSTRNGIASNPYENWEGSFRIEAVIIKVR